MLARTLLLCVLLLGTAAVPAGARIVPGTGMAGVAIGDCEASVRGKLGRPGSVTRRSDFAGPSSNWRYSKRGLRVTFRSGASCQAVTAISTDRGFERTAEGIGKGSRRTTLRARLRGERCRTYRVPEPVRSCTLGAFRPGRVVTDFRIDSRARVSSVLVGIVID